MVRLVTLGECAIEVGGETRVGPDAEMVYAALLVLAFEAGRRVPRQELVQLLWPWVDEKRARHSLRQTLYRIRRLGVAVETTEIDVCLPASSVRADFAELEAGVPDAGRASLASVGDFLPGYAPALSSSFTKRLERYRDQALAHVRRVLVAALDECRRASRWADTESLARRCLQLDPLNEAATLALAEATAMTGNKARALEILDRYTAEAAGGGEGRARDLVRVQPAILRRRITEHVPEHRYGAAAEAEFIGREDSIAFLSALFEEARAGRGCGCLVWGDAGIGKTRLVTEFTDAAALRGARVQRVGCQPSDVHRPLSVFVDVVPSLLNLPGALGCSPESMSYLKRLTEHDRSSTTPSEASREAEFLYGRVRRALLDLLDAIAAEGTLVLVVEDVHWLDPMSWSVLRETIEWGAARRLMIIMTSRTSKLEDEPPRWAGRPLDRHHVGPLAERETARLVVSLLRGVEHAELDGSVLARWADLADGNPLFARELVQQWLATGETEKLPGSLLALVDARINRLTSAALRIVQAAAVLGKNTTHHRLEAILDFPRYTMLAALEEAELAAVIASAPASLRVRHDLLADGALRRLSTASRQVLHAAAAQLLENDIDASQSVSLLWDAAGHWQAAGSIDRAVHLALARGAHLLELGLPREAVDIYERLLRLDGAIDHQQQVLECLVGALTASNQWARLIPVIDRLEALRHTAGEDCRHGELELTRIYAQWVTNGDLEALGCQATACVIDASLPIAHRVEAASHALILAWSAGNLDRFRLVGETISPYLSSSHIPNQLRAHVRLVIHTLGGSFDEGVAAARVLIGIERSSGSMARLARALRHASNAFIRAGMVSDALASLSEAFSLHQQTHSPGHAVTTAAELGQLYLDLGDQEFAREWHMQAVHWQQFTENPLPGDSLRFLAARLALLDGNPEQANHLLGASFERLRQDRLPIRRVEALSLWIRTQIALGNGVVPEAVDSLRTDLLTLSWAFDRDYDIHSLYLALCSLGQVDEGNRVVVDFVTRVRKWRSPLYSELAKVLDNCVPRGEQASR